jgi:hypothetical protein
MSMLLTYPPGFEPITEALTKTDKDEVGRIVRRELEKSVKTELGKILEDELTKALRSKASKEEIGDVAKTVLKKLYKDLAYHHPYVIDRIKI